MKPIAIFYHCLFYKDETFLPAAMHIIRNQMAQVDQSGLLGASSEFIVGINGGQESLEPASIVLPETAKIILHGLQCKNEVRTLIELQKWLPGHEDWLVFYFHSKGATKPVDDTFSATWRECMMRHNVINWRTCVMDLESGYEAVGAHWMEPPETPDGQYIFAGTFWWATAKFLLSIPPITERDRIKESGIDAIESRYEAEVFLGIGQRKPNVKDYHPNWNPSKIATCIP